MLKGIIINNISNIYSVECIENKKIYKCNARGKFKNEEITPVVGDFVEFTILDEKNNEAVIDTIFERTNFVKRPKMANLTQIIFVLSIKMPKPDLLLLDKQLAFAEFLNIKSIICINKIDLEKDEEIQKIYNLYTKIGYQVLLTEATNGKGVEQLKNLLVQQKNKINITAFSGNSGVGKSTLINQLFNKNLTQEGVISNKIQRGKNTTTAINLYKIQENNYIADTPGFSTFDIFEIPSEELFKYFKEFNEYESNCEFVGCSHIKEKACGIKHAVQQDKIDLDRYNRYCKIYLELKEKEKFKW